MALVSRHLALTAFERAGAVGRDLFLADDWPKRPYRVIGIVEDVRSPALGGALQPLDTIYLSVLQHPARELELSVQASDYDPYTITPSLIPGGPGSTQPVPPSAGGASLPSNIITGVRGSGKPPVPADTGELMMQADSERGRPITPQLLMGLLVIAVGVLFTLDNLDLVDARQYIRFWPVGLIAIGVLKLWQSRGGGGTFAALLITLAGTWLLLESLVIVTVSFVDLWPMLLVLFGASLVWHGVRGRRAG